MEITSAQRCRPLTVPQNRGNVFSQMGVRYERRLFKAIQALGFKAEHNPWFMYTATGFRPQFCSPDIILDHDQFLIVVECKLTYRKQAEEKLLDLYIPVVKLATGQKRVYPLVICKNLTPFAPTPSLSLPEALTKSYVDGMALFQYLG
ncbi:MAG TPA: hypothetical protein VH280_00020 [Verrucomicrobiae bacterium]|nr:hypothetical protein [Verrucomicrobiae bacterium]